VEPNDYAMAVAVTTAHKEDYHLQELARQISRELDASLVPRRKKSVDLIARESGVPAVVVVGRQRVTCHVGGGEFFFHPGLAALRIKEIKSGKTDQMIKSLDLGPGDTLLDCTLGLGTDAIVASYVVGSRGRVVGLEASPVVACLVKYGLASYKEAASELIEAMRRVEVVLSDHLTYLHNMTPGSFDVVYFDPMFRRAIHKSSAMRALRPLARGGSPGLETVNLALRVARRRVVIKERSGSEEFKRLGCLEVSGGKHAPVAYGILEKGMVSG
jgi:ubiquinone/menaquinone biosynthesis C-methylase UbiE